MTRFFAHLCLYLQMIDIPVASLGTQVIIPTSPGGMNPSYVKLINTFEAAGERDLIAMYAGALGDNAVDDTRCS